MLQVDAPGRPAHPGAFAPGWSAGPGEGTYRVRRRVALQPREGSRPRAALRC